MEVQKIITENYGTNSYIIDNNYVVDPGLGIGKFINEKIDILLTHAHFDHLLGINELNYGKIYLHPDDFEMIKNPDLNLSNMIGKPIQIKDNLYDISKKFDILHTPGHTNGSVVIIFKNHIFTGDTVFSNSIGRTDLPGGDQEKIGNSLKTLKNYFLKNDRNIKIHPGHMDETTIGNILEDNPYLL
ncbi:MAG: MBL fold metallo-hydrolase [Thermotogota bacterium]